MRTTFIYTLSDPRTGEVRYVGKTVHLGRRLYCHLHMQDHGGNGRTHSARWIKALMNHGVEPVMEVIEEIISDDPSKWTSAEQFWITYLRFIGCRLTNATKGGEGLLGYRHSSESRMLMAARRRGSRATEETKKKLSEARRGRKLSKEHIEKVANWHRGKKRSIETVKKLSEIQRGNKGQAVAAAAARLKNKGRKLTKEHVEKVRAALTGKKRSPDQINRIRESQIKSYREGRSGQAKATLAARAKVVGSRQSQEHIARRVSARRITMSRIAKEAEFWEAAM